MRFEHQQFYRPNSAQVEDFLTASLGGGVCHVVGIEHGEWSAAYAFEDTGRDRVARFSALREDFAKDHRAAGYTSPELPIPRIIHIGAAFGGFYAISERAPGGYLDDLGETDMRAILPTLFTALDAARQVDLSTTAGYGLWNADGAGAYPTWQAALLDVANERDTARTYGWRRRLAASPIGCGPFDAAFEQLQELVSACPEARHLVHSDLLNYNVLVSGGAITALIDWGSSLYGDFLYDLAWLCFWAPWYPAWRGIDFAGEGLRHYEAIGLNVPHFEERLRCYQVHIGLDGQIYKAFKGRWLELEATASRTLEVARPKR